MKNTILFVLLHTIVITLQAQDDKIFICSSHAECVASADSLLKHAKRIYILEDSFVYDKKYILDYSANIPTDSSMSKVRAIFKPRIIGENADFEIRGVVVYELENLCGKFLDLFPVWQKYVDPSANKELLSARGSSGYPPFDFPASDGKSGVNYTFKREDKGIWILSRYYYWHE